MNDCTRDIIRLINDLNSTEGKFIAAYTVDAGANAFIICELDNIEKIFSGF